MSRNNFPPSLIKNIIGGVILFSMIFIVFAIPFVDLVTKKEVDSQFFHQLSGLSSSNSALVFFGFQKCEDVCPKTMFELKKLTKYSEGFATFPQVVFIDIDKNSNQENAEKYAHYFSEKFIGYFPESQELEQLKMYFGLNVKQSGEVISHVGRVYLLEKIGSKWWLRKAFSPKDMSAEKLIKDLNLSGDNHA